MPTTQPRRRLSLLDSIRIASPCSARWEDMKGDERIRFCASCEKHVYNLSAMPADEAEDLLEQGGASLCVRLYRREDGTVLTEDCPVGARKKRVRRVLAGAAGAGALVAAAAAGVLFTPTTGALGPREGTTPAPPVTGAVAMMGGPAPAEVAVMGSAAATATPAPDKEKLVPVMGGPRPLPRAPLGKPGVRAR